EQQCERAGAGEFHLHDVVVQADVGEPHHLAGIGGDGRDRALQEHLVVDVPVGVNDVGADLRRAAANFVRRKHGPDDDWRDTAGDNAERETGEGVNVEVFRDADI